MLACWGVDPVRVWLIGSSVLFSGESSSATEPDGSNSGTDSAKTFKRAPEVADVGVDAEARLVELEARGVADDEAWATARTALLVVGLMVVIRGAELVAEVEVPGGTVWFAAAITRKLTEYEAAISFCRAHRILSQSAQPYLLGPSGTHRVASHAVRVWELRS